MTQRLMGLSLCVVLLGIVFATGPFAEAQQNRHYSIKTTVSTSTVYSYYETLWPLQENLDWLKKTAGQVVSLIEFKVHRGPIPTANEPYNRKKHFGTWVNVQGCRNTRHMVLERDSEIPVNWDRCKVLSGRWKDPYSGEYFDDPRDLEIDHFVPLKNAYVSGAWKWDKKTKCVYANFTGNASHLKPVSSYENTMKSDLTPEYYMPSDETYACTYLKEWLYIKSIWNLVLSDSEVSAIKELIEEYHCSIDDFKVEMSEIKEQRKLINQPNQHCK